LVTLVLPAYNEAKVIEKTINSLLRLSYKNKEILVVDDGSTDDTLKIAKKLARNSPITVISKSNGGKWSALNRAVEEAKGEILVCIDADTILDENAIQPLIPYFEDKKVAAVAGNIKVGNRKKGLTKMQALEYVLGLNIQRRNESIIGKLSVVPGPLGAFRKSVVKEVGMYSRDTFAEDADLTFSIIRAGYKIKYEKRAIGYTEAPSTLLDLGKQRYRWYRGQLQVMKKHKKAVFRLPWVFFDGILLSWFSFFSLLWLFLLMFNPYAAFNIFQMPNSHPAHVNLPPQAAAVNENVFQSIPLLYIFLFLVIEGIELLIALYATLIDVKEKPRLALNILFYNLLYMKLLDTIRIFSQIEEFLNYPMKWEIAERTGKVHNRT
jgi:poly-beta-1,6 N-acetyl-D-glucosamine synthase